MTRASLGRGSCQPPKSACLWRCAVSVNAERARRGAGVRGGLGEFPMADVAPAFANAIHHRPGCGGRSPGGVETIPPQTRRTRFSWEVTSRHGRGHCMVTPSSPPHALVILFNSTFPRQRTKPPGEQRFAAVVSDDDHLLQPEPLVLAARIEQMNGTTIASPTSNRHSTCRQPCVARCPCGKGRDHGKR